MELIYDLLRQGFFFALVGFLVILSILMVLINAVNTWRTNTTQRAAALAKVSESETKAKTELLNSYARVLEAQEKQKDVAYNTLLRAIMSKANLKLEDFADIMGTVNTTVKKSEAESSAEDIMKAILDDTISVDDLQKILLEEEQ